jgi:hypothetical protein
MTTEILYPPKGLLGVHRGYEKHRDWLLAFFQDEPKWEEEVKNWILKFKQTSR